MKDYVALPTGELFKIATDAYLRSKEVRRDNHDALIAVVFACATLESYMNQTVMFAEGWKHNHPKIRAFSSIIGGLVEERGVRPQIVYSTARWVLTGTNYEHGQTPFQDFNLLIRIRNAYMHLKPDYIGDIRNPKSSAESKILEELENKKLIVNKHKPMRGAWTMYLYNPAVAKWACNTASAMIQGFWKGSDPKVEEFFHSVANADYYKPVA
jgi:hypothetical protein